MDGQDLIWRRRKDGPGSLKAVKDRAQAAFLIEALAEDRPDDLAEAYQDAAARGPRWRERLAATLQRMPATRALLEQAGAIQESLLALNLVLRGDGNTGYRTFLISIEGGSASFRPLTPEEEPL